MRCLCLCIVALCISSTLGAGIEKYFKKIKHKTDMHKMDGIDFIYMINLDERPEKFAICKQQLDRYEIYPYRFSAVNGWKLPFNCFRHLGVKYSPEMASLCTGLWGTTYDFNDGKLHDELIALPGRCYFCRGMGCSHIGIVLSHLSCLQDAYDSGYKTIWVMEDDINVIRNPHLVSEAIEKLDKLVGQDGWDILFTDQDTKDRNGTHVICLSYARRPNFTPEHPERFAERQIINPEFRKIGARYGAYSMIIRRSGIKKLLNFFKNYKIFLPYDMDYFLPNNLHIFTVVDDIVSVLPKALSDNRAPNYERK